ncbi:DNA-binding transcriptional LysR family regulator [Polaromonas sp. CG_9.11]|nr:DNA-binding transcriptional LysR family regulator [Polaromonas sp. CG_9.11]
MKTPVLSHLDFNLLLDLDALLREGSVVGAARIRYLSAPAMSRRLARLREAIGDPLFVPAGRGLVPTQRALDLSGRVQAAIEEVRGVFTPQDVDFSRLERTLTLRTNDGFAGTWATRLAAALTAEAPDISLQFVPHTDKNIDALRSGVVDLDIGVLRTAEPEIYNELLFEASFVGVVRENHPLLSRKKTKSGGAVSAQDFVAWPHIATSPNGRATGRLDEALKELGLRRRVVIAAPGFQSALVMAATSDFLAVMPEPFVRWAMAHHRLHIFKLPVVIRGVEVSQSWHVRQHADPVHRWLRGHVRAKCNTDE